jgi:hypothetical protein
VATRGGLDPFLFFSVLRTSVPVHPSFSQNTSIVQLVEVVSYHSLKLGGHRSDHIHAFLEPVPVQLKTIAMMNNTPELPKSRHRQSQGVVKEKSQGSIGRMAEMLEEGNMPGISSGERDGVEIADSL